MSVRNKAIAVIDFHEGLHPEDLYETLINSIDWNRVRLEAHGRRLKLHGYLRDDDMPCGECIAAALLTPDTFPEWT